MSFRSIEVQLRANVGQYTAQLGVAARSTKEFHNEVVGAAREGNKAMEMMSKGLLVAGAAGAVGLGKMVTTAAGFEKQMSGVQAVSGASADEMNRLSDAALAAGASTQLAGVTASDAAKAEAELVKAGVSVSDILGGSLMGSLTLASAGQLDFAEAAEIAAGAMNIFNLQGSQVTHIADVLAASANSTSADVGGLGESLKQSGLVAAQTGLSFEETVTALSAFAENTLKGSDAGTSLKTMLQRLTPQSAEARELMDELGFSAYDAAGNFIGLEALAGELQTSLSGMTNEQRNAAMATLFGSDAVRAANVLYKEGAEGIARYAEMIDDQGAAARMAAIQNDNLAGDVEALGGAIESAFIENGSKATGALRSLTQTATAAVNGFSSMPEPVQTTAVALVGVASAGSLVVGGLGTLAPKLEQGRQALGKMGRSGEILNNNLTKIGGTMAVLGAGMAVWGAWETMMADARAEADKLKDVWHAQAMSHATDGLAAFKRELRAVRDNQEMLNRAADSSSAPWDADKRAALREGSKNLGNTASEMEKIIRVSDELALSLGISGDAAIAFVLEQQSAGIDVLDDDWRGVTAAMMGAWGATREGTVASQNLTGAVDTLGSEIATVEEQVEAFEAAIDALYNTMFGTEAAADELQSSINALPGVLEEAATSGLNLNDVLTGQSDAAIDVRGHMRGMIEDATALITEWREQGITGDELRAKIDYLSGSFRQQAIDAGLPAPVVDHYLGLLGQIPIDKTTDITAITHTQTAEQDLTSLARDRTARITAIVVSGGARRSGKSLTDTIIGPGGEALLDNRWGGAYEYSSGRVTSVEAFARGGIGITPAHIAEPGPIYKYAEPPTAGETFVPAIAGPLAAKILEEITT